MQLNLLDISPTPFSCFLRQFDKYLFCASPERFIKKKENKLISQPIKGTFPRGKSEMEDRKLVEELRHDHKERSENIMIVDLVRNDLSRTAEKSSVLVEELCHVYTFANVHQLISTVVCKLDKKYTFADSIKNAFPMGSMTGAPKIRAMEIIDESESCKRELFSGAVGYIDPHANYDFNVVIRSIQYNDSKPYLNCIVGGAITSKSKLKDEYKECLLKAQTMMQVLKSNNDIK